MHFSFPRFLLLLKMQFAVNRRLYLLGSAAIAGLLLVYMIFRAANADFGFEYFMQAENYALSLCLMSVVFGTMIFRQYDGKPGRTQALMLPASALEKLAVALLMVFAVFPAAYSLIYFLCNLLTNQLDVHMFGHPNELYLLNGGEEIMGVFLLAMTLPIVIFCAIWFRRLTFVKTIVMLCLPVLVFSFFNELLGKMAVRGVHPAHPEGGNLIYWASRPFKNLLVTVNRPTERIGQLVYDVSLPSAQQWVFTLFAFSIPLLFLYLAYLKLREQEL